MFIYLCLCWDVKKNEKSCLSWCFSKTALVDQYLDWERNSSFFALEISWVEMCQVYFDNVTIQFNLFGIIMDPELMSAHSLSLIFCYRKLVIISWQGGGVILTHFNNMLISYRWFWINCRRHVEREDNSTLSLRMTT